MAFATITTAAGAENLTGAAGKTLECTFTISNESGSPLRLGLEPKADSSLNVTVSEPIERDLPAGSHEQVRVEIGIPAQIPGGSSYKVQLRAYDRDNHERTVLSPVVAVSVPAGTVSPPPPPPPPPSKLWLWILLGVLGLLIVGALIWWLMRDGAVIVPDLKGMPTPKAEAALTAVKLKIGDVAEEVTDAQPVDTVLRTKPEAGTEVASDSAIDVLIAAAPPPRTRTCYDAVQGKIAWNYSGDTNWSTTNVNQLCDGAEDSAAPAQCIQRVLHGNVNWGGGTQWAIGNAISLCQGSPNANTTINCFTGQIQSNVTWEKAIPACNGKPVLIFDMKILKQVIQPVLTPNFGGRRTVPPAE